MKEWSMPSLTLTELFELFGTDGCLLVDVRTPKEFEEYHLPHAVNVPIFTNEERETIGTTYKQIGKEEAVQEGLSIFSKKLPTFYESLKTLKASHTSQPLVVYCWRGGMRSGTVVSMMNGLGLPCFQLIGGIRSYRKHVQETLAAPLWKEKTFIVLSGNTGTMKTDILHYLLLDGYPVIQLEECANHRGSLFGHIGKEPSRQKAFEASLAMRLEELVRSPYLIMEAESKRIGTCVLPDFLIEGKVSGKRVECHVPFSKRVEHLATTYQLNRYPKATREATEKVEKYLPHQVKEEVYEALAVNDERRFISLLLENYYDKRYAHAATQYGEKPHKIKYETVEAGVEKTKEVIERIVKTMQ